MSRYRLVVVSSICILIVIFCLINPNVKPSIASRDIPPTRLTTPSKGSSAKVSRDLITLYETFTIFTRHHRPQSFTSSIPWMPVAGEWVTIDALATNNGYDLLRDLQSLGLKHGASTGRLVSGNLPIAAIQDLKTLKNLHSVLPAYAITHSGLASTAGDIAMRADVARATYNVDGSSVLVGTLSDSYDCLGGATTDISTGDLPSDTLVLKDEPGCAFGSDEGRGMMQIIADIAPGATQLFHTAMGGQASFVQGITALADTGADVIVDDIGYLTEPFFQDGMIAQTVDSVVANGIAYFSAAGDAGRHSYQDTFRSSISDGPYGKPLHDFNASFLVDDAYQELSIPTGSAVSLSFQWQNPYASAGEVGASTDLDIYLFNATRTQAVASSTLSNIGGDPIEVLSYENTGPDTTFHLAIEHHSGPTPDLIKYVIFSSGGSVTINEYNTQSSTLFGHANAAGAEAVGAAFFGNTPAFGQSPPLLESFSSAGSVPILFSPSGTLAIMDTRDKPEIVAPDGGNTTFFGQDIPEDADSYPNFFGTSAAAAHAAAVAALMLEGAPTLSPATLYTALETNTIDMGAPGFDNDSGYGLIQADAALAAVIAPPAVADLIISKHATPEIAFAGDILTYTLTITNHGPLTTTIAQVTDTLPTNVIYIPGSLSGTQGIPTWNPINRNVMWNGEVFSGTSISIHYAVWVTPVLTTATPIVNIARISGDLIDPDILNNLAEKSIIANPLPGPGVSPPQLHPISNPDEETHYLVDWSIVTDTLTYTLQEDDNADFTSPITRYVGPNTLYLVTDQENGTWHYRVKATTAEEESAWSITQSVTVTKGITLKYHFMLLVLQNYPPAIVRNGDFELGNLSFWKVESDDPYYAPQVVTSYTHRGAYAAVLGKENAPCEGHVGGPSGSSSIAQRLEIPDYGTPTLSFYYRLLTYDNLDRFDVTIAGELKSSFHYTGTINPDVACLQPPHDLGWQRYTYDLSPYRGQSITLTLSTINVDDNWFSTWTYVDDITVLPGE